MKRILLVALLIAPLPGCTGAQVSSAGEKAAVACESAIRVCTVAGGILGWELAPVDWSVEGMTRAGTAKVETDE